ncbi:SAM-dependent methyltransferase [Salisediminibacterium halotolerans]|uniref:SAM-dependent methyltransferase n=1 Tax=Salisediminibacterium halotolerans TaxID=517425 RepID=UPI000EB0568A|nr:cyclopropane-fatty-acyl-phospholipid synthase family protein [Salisediminibacterium halotolerans]RLJ72242.1 cyclopropane-fatty-acyl-phospholipid synthase [Actinophytocola xinjiangensis]RPE85455.1 cyclopropane-fatty-acyl-phospholipid synthase [Salisediminibacterium halotolerans]TWG33412.1 cyclopropane-fatty-acyl-phospholipid synthase [Salisediminibacterium halotolerans]GEL07866.1 cyclopropane-fatty-acyl-phospholipid synthase [Salisediminibacterium halotolerans]
MWYEPILEKNLVPDTTLRFAVRRLLKTRLQKQSFSTVEEEQAYIDSFIKDLKEKPIAVHTEDANEQHYEVPAHFFEKVLGTHLKYSCSYWHDDITSLSYSEGLNKAEEDMLALTCERADLQNGQSILELGCGWGSLSLYMARQFPDSKITVLSNSSSQKTYIDQQAAEQQLTNLTVVTADINDYTTTDRFDRVVSVEMFEHMQNYQLLMQKVASFLNPDGKLFIHIFCHKRTPYLFEVKSSGDWMAKYFFTGGMMPSAHLPLYFADDLAIEKHWAVSGLHYHKTCEAWLQKMDQQKDTILPIFREVYGEEEGERWWVFWRIFFIACSELFATNNGNEWYVGHYRFSKRQLER